MSEIYRNEPGYIRMVRDILLSGVDIPDRTGVGSRAIFDAKIVYDTDVIFPFSTIRPAPLRMAFEEFWFFLNGYTQTKLLEEKGVNFWKGNTSREFLDNRNLLDLPEGDMGMSYGYQWRGFGGWYGYTGFAGGGQKYGDAGHDQLVEVYQELRKNPYSRRLYTTFWNPQHSHRMALTPCWHSHQWVVLPDGQGNDVLHLKLLNRSLDSVFGLSFAVQQYALYQVAMAKLLGMKVGKLSCDLTQIHIYNNQLAYAYEMIYREFEKAGEVEITKPLNSLEDLLQMTWDDVRVTGLEVNKSEFVTPRPEMAV